MVAQNILRVKENKSEISDYTPSKQMLLTGQITEFYPDWRGAPISELPSNISIMAGAMVL